MIIPKIFLVIITLFIASCAGAIQSQSLADAYKQYDRQKYSRVLELITRAENIKETSADMKAELIYLKALTYEKLGQKSSAAALYEYLAEEFNETQHGYLAGKKLQSAL